MEPQGRKHLRNIDLDRRELRPLVFSVSDRVKGVYESAEGRYMPVWEKKTHLVPWVFIK
jgi:hypothetical protein